MLYSFADNVYINYTSALSGGIPSGANCGEGNGIVPKPRLFNNTYINAIPVTNAYIVLPKYLISFLVFYAFYFYLFYGEGIFLLICIFFAAGFAQLMWF